LLDDHAFQTVGYERKLTQYGEFFFNFAKTLCLLLKACNLHEHATQVSVKLALSIDGANLVRDCTHVSCGIKLTDEKGYHPITNQPLFLLDEDGEELFVKLQSREVYCLMVIALAKDKKDLYEDTFKDFFIVGVKSYRLKENLHVMESLPSNLLTSLTLVI
jgi:hypothetical protein